MRKIFLLIIASLFITACSAAHTAITKRNLEIQTKMSNTIFLEPVANDKKIVFVNIRNTSGNTDLNIEPYIIGLLAHKGYKITQNPDDAFFILQANVLQAGKLENKNSLTKSLGDAIVPGIAGGAIGANNNGDAGMVIGAVAGATLGFVGSSFIEDVKYSIISDLQISQKITPGMKFAKDKEKDGWKRHSTRVISYANKVNLNYKEAEPKLIEALANSIAGVL